MYLRAWRVTNIHNDVAIIDHRLSESNYFKSFGSDASIWMSVPMSCIIKPGFHPNATHETQATAFGWKPGFMKPLSSDKRLFLRVALWRSIHRANNDDRRHLDVVANHIIPWLYSSHVLTACVCFVSSWSLRFYVITWVIKYSLGQRTVNYYYAMHQCTCNKKIITNIYKTNEKQITNFNLI